MTNIDLDLSALPPELAWKYRALQLEKDAQIERDRSKRWQLLAEHYDDIRYALRNCDDDPVGHAQFYKECCLIIFGQYRDLEEEPDE